MTIASLTPTTTTPSGPGTAASTATDGSGVTSDYQTFLRMLTAQIRNQDPLNPIQASDYAVQLATFSGVEQQVKTNDLLQALSSQLGASGLSGLAGWVGKEVRATGAVAFDGVTPVTLSTSPEARADQAVLVTLDATGSEVLRQPVPINGGAVKWTGSDGQGTRLPAGSYSFRLESYRSGSAIGEGQDVAAYRRVTEVRLGTDGTEVLLSDGTLVPAAQVTGLREPS